MCYGQSVGEHTNGFPVLEVLRGLRRPFDEIHAANFENEFGEYGEPSSDSDVPSETGSDWAISSSEDSGDFRKPASIQESIGFTELGISLSERPTKEVPQLLYSLKLTITSLYKMPIRRPAPAERLDRLAKASFNETSIHEHFDCMYVRDVFNKADEKLVIRLGRMITRRRQLLQYRQAHNKRLIREMDDSKEQIDKAKSYGIIDIRPSSASILRTEPPIKSLALDSKFNQGSRATTFKPPNYPLDFTKNFEVQSLPETVSTLPSTRSGGEQLAIPSCPKGSNGEDLEDFICPYCYVFRHITSLHQWKRHVMCDLEPYVCTFENCSRTNDMFESQEDWYNHETQQHRLDYSCNVKDHEQYTNVREFRSHMNEEHNVQFNDEQLKFQLSMFSRPTQRKSGICPLCMESTVQLKGHLARHLERIALFALPRQSNTKNDSSANNTSGENVASIRNTEASVGDGSSWNSDGDRKALSFPTNREKQDSPNLEYADMVQEEVPESAAFSWDYIALGLGPVHIDIDIMLNPCQAPCQALRQEILFLSAAILISSITEPCLVRSMKNAPCQDLG